MSSSTYLKADLLLISATILAAFGWIFSKSALAGFTPLLFLALRFSGAGFLLFSLGGFRQLKQLSAKQWKIGLLGGVLFAFGMMFWITGLHLSAHIGVGAFLSNMGLVLVPVIGLFFGERPTVSAWMSLPVVAVGLACLSLDKEFVMGVGEISFVASASLFASGFIVMSRASASMPTFALTTIQLLCAGSISLVASIMFETWDFHQPLNIWFWLLASILLGTSLRFFIQLRAQGMTPASHAAIIMVLEPVWAAILAGIWLGDTMTQLQFVGCSLIFAAMLINRWRMVRYALMGLVASVRRRVVRCCVRGKT